VPADSIGCRLYDGQDVVIHNYVVNTSGNVPLSFWIGMGWEHLLCGSCTPSKFTVYSSANPISRSLL